LGDEKEWGPEGFGRGEGGGGGVGVSDRVGKRWVSGGGGGGVLLGSTSERDQPWRKCRLKGDFRRKGRMGREG